MDQCWSMDFVADNPFNERRLRALAVINNFSRECVAIEVCKGLRSDDVVAQTQQRVLQRLQTDNSSEFNVLESPQITPWLSHQTAACVVNV